MKFEKTKLIGFSFAFYNKSNFKEYLINEKGGLEESHKRLLGEDNYKCLLEFNQALIDQQRDMLSQKPKELMKTFMEALFTLESDKNLLSYILPYIDAILFDRNDMVSVILEISKEKPKLDLIAFLKNILVSKESIFNSIIYDSSARILSAIYSDFDQA